MKTPDTINGKTPEEIKGIMANPRDCMFDLCSFMRSALAYIQQLEERNERLEYTLCGVMHSIDKWLDAEPYDFDKDDGTEAATRASNSREVALKAIEQLETRLAQAERERDAAVADLENVIGLSSIVNLDCEYCKHMDRPVCKKCEWKWRGV